MKLVFFLFAILAGVHCYAQDKTIPGEVETPYPTIVNLAIEWMIEGDDNQNGIVTVKFREKGEKTWKEGMPLRRVPAGNSGNRTRPTYTWENKHSGSIFDLKPGTGYEITLILEDPDGGSTQRTVYAETRPVPHYDDHAEIVELKSGTHDTLFTRDGTAQRPVVYRCSSGKAIFTHIDLKNRNWVFIEDLTVINFDHEGIGIQFNGARNCVIRNCEIDAVYGIVSYKPGAENCYISDNIVTGISAWTNVAMGAHGANIGEGIQLTGPGNVICYNRVTGFRDCISTMEDTHAGNQTCIDIYNNDVYRGPDDGIEADFCFSNCRIFRNRITNCYVGLSSQPGLGGPTYFVRNVMYNVVHAAFKLKRFSQGDVVLHNTVIKVGAGLGGNSAMDHAYFRNNLAIGGPTGGVNWGDYGAGNPYAADIVDPGIHSDFDYDAVGVYEVPFIARIGGRPFSAAEKHGVEQITLEETFANIAFPNPPIPERAVPDLRPKRGSRVIDAGMVIPNINDDFLGGAPDCGAYEAGQPLPHYGPRPGIIVFEDDFKGGSVNWVVEKFDRDAVDVVDSENSLTISTEQGVDGVMVWCKNPLPENFMVEYDFMPVSESGFFGIFFCTEKRDQGDILDHIDDHFTTYSLFEKYTRGETNSYHISYRRNDNPTSNLRKNPGEGGGALLKQQTLPCVLSAGRTHHVVLNKSGGHISLFIDQQEFMNFEDDGTDGSQPYSGGRFGIRQVYDAEGIYDNFRIWDLDSR
jgi:hypothetical protein